MATRTEPTHTLKPPVTAQEWGDIDGSPRYELVDGRLKEKPSVAFWHEILLLSLARLIGNHVADRRIGVVVASNAKLKISTYGGREPDLFFIPNDQQHLIGKNLFKGVPPLVVEVLSPSSEREDRVEKNHEYAQLGIGEYWIVDFPNRRIEVHHLQARPEGNTYTLAETVTGDGVFRPALFPGLEIRLGEVWPADFEHRTDD